MFGRLNLSFFFFALLYLQEKHVDGTSTTSSPVSHDVIKTKKAHAGGGGRPVTFSWFKTAMMWMTENPLFINVNKGNGLQIF